ncbi:MAG: OmpA/MotB family protein [Fidelibacterota bacterium]
MKFFSTRQDALSSREKAVRSSWILSFGDIMTLLLTFFIMMIARQSGEISRIHQWTHNRLEETGREIQSVIEKQDLSAFTVNYHSKGVQITISGESLFDPGKADPLPEFRRQLTDLAYAIRTLDILDLTQTEHKQLLRELRGNGLAWQVEIRIEGHTDNVPLGPNVKFRDNWELSAARAQSVMRILHQGTGIPEERFAVAGFGEFNPVASNETEAGRNRNRRVEIYIDASIQKIQ